MESVSPDEVYQDQILPHVSRTFALTIPQLPPALATPVTSAYLLCRIADTIEDEPALSPPETLVFLQRFSALVGGQGDAAQLARDLEKRLSDRTLATERDLVSHMDRVIRVTAALKKPQLAAIRRCVELMCYGMPRFQFNASLRGLVHSTDLDDYCYYVAGVVGEMLTELFCEYSPEIGRQRAALSTLAASFAQGLQMTNILKDVWEDRSRGACWLPQEVFKRYGIDLGEIGSGSQPPRFDEAMAELIGLAHAHLRNALDYTLLIPAKETGIRRFCLWAIGLAILTLRKVAKNPGFTCGAQVKVTRAAVSMTLALSNAFVRNDWMLKKLFATAASGVPRGRIPEMHRMRPAPTIAAADTVAATAAATAVHEHELHRSYGSSGN
jgi:farnesyl-diphosphate farnesyltransferase